ncbi:conserved hypothetical protein [sediment metagenome]|uniref:Antitoxin n=1 Tax=sediment metagenome TaxID=749907 RepID=D9PM63_9ZZZZ
MKAVTIRGVDQEVAKKLKSTAAKQGKSINQVALECIKKNLGLEKRKKYSCEYNDLDDLFGTWSKDEFNRIHNKIDRERGIDPELWK